MIVEIYSKYPIYGYRRIHAILKQNSIVVNRTEAYEIDEFASNISKASN